MKKNTLKMMSAALILTAALLSACGSAAKTGTQNTASASTTGTTTVTAGSTASGSTSGTTASGSTSGTTASGSTAGTTASSGNASSLTAEALTVTDTELFTKRDLTQTADVSEAEAIIVSDGQTISLTEAGVYTLSGEAKNVTIVVNAGDEDKVQLVLDGLTLTNTDQPCLLVENADKVFVTLAEGSSNSLSVTGQFSGDEDAVIFSRDDLVLNGLGTAVISSTKDGIRSNDDIKLTGGSWTVTASKNAVKAHESILASDGSYTLTAGSDGLHAEDNDDDTKGSIVIEGGSFTIQAADDGIHATTTVTVNGGAVSIRATDDGINAGRKSAALTVKIEINGGELNVTMASGDTDGVDSNGDLIITGGTISISAQSPFDYDGSCSYTGGTIIVNGTVTNSVTNQMMGGGGMGGQMGGFGKR